MRDEFGSNRVEHLLLRGRWGKNLIKAKMTFVKMYLIGGELEGGVILVARPNPDTDLNRILRFGIHFLTVIKNNENNKKRDSSIH